MQINQSMHVKPILYTDTELKYITKELLRESIRNSSLIK